MKVAIVGGGLSGMSAAWQAHSEGLEFKLFEANSRLGGLLSSEKFAEDLVAEGGAESSLRSKPELLDLCKELGLEEDIISTIPENAGAFVVRDGLLHPIPQGFRLMAPSAAWPFLRSDLISWPGKIRAALDLVLPVKERSAGLADESLSEFVTRRMGTEILHYLAQPLVAGIYGADPQFLSLEATMPLFQRLEQEHGSVIRGLRAMGTEGESRGARYNLFFSLKNGFGSIIQAMIDKLPGESLATSSRVDSICTKSSGHGWEVSVRGSQPESFDSLVLALPAPQAADLVEPLLPDVAGSLREIEYRGAVTVNMAYQKEIYLDFVPRAYGFVVPAQERRPLLACTFSSRKWPFRGNDQLGVLRTYFGGPGMEWANTATDEDLIAVSMGEMKGLLGLAAEPVECRVHRWPMGLPEYRVGHRQRVQSIKNALTALPTLSLAGNYLDGVGLPDCVRLGRRAVSQFALV